MIKKIIINTFLLLSLMSATTVFARLGHKPLTERNLLVFQPQRQFVIPQNYFILGGPLWMGIVQENDSQLNQLHAAAIDPANENNAEVRSRYLYVLRHYVTAICEDFRAIDRFFEFNHFLSQVQKEDIAGRLLTVVYEHNAFLSEPNYQADICTVSQFSDEYFARMCDDAVSLQARLSNILPHEADDEVDILEEQDE